MRSPASASPSPDRGRGAPRLASQTSFRDGRLVAIAAVAAYFSILGLLSASGRLALPWRALGVEQGPWPFMDLDNVLSAAECARRGLDPLVANPCDLAGRPMNYPRAWLALGTLGVTRAWLVPSGIALGAASIAAVLLPLGRLTRAGGVLAAAALCSPAFMLLVERGNVDAVVLVLVVGAAALVSSRSFAARATGYGLVVLAAALKLFPIAAGVIALREPDPRRRWGAVGAMALGFVGLLLVTWEDMVTISRTVPRNLGIGYGAGVLPGGLALAFGVASPEPSLGVPFSVAALAIAFAGFVRGWRRPAHPGPAWTESTAGLAFAAGTAVYAGTFVVGHNWAYRLAFAVLTLPYLVRRAEPGETVRTPFVATVALLVTVLFLAPLAPEGAAAAAFLLWWAGQLASWALLLGLAWALGEGIRQKDAAAGTTVV